MARSRMIRPEFWDDEKLSKISRDARLTFIGIWNHSDDYGVAKGNHQWLKNKIFPYNNIKNNIFDGWIKQLVKMNALIPFIDNGEAYYFIKNFLKHQKVNRPSKQRNPEPPQQTLEDSLSAHGVLIDETETEVKQKQKQKPKFIPPTENQVIEYFKENGYLVKIGKKAFKYYDVASWKDRNGDKVKNWKQKIIANWFKDENKDNSNPKNTVPALQRCAAGPCQTEVMGMKYCPSCDIVIGEAGCETYEEFVSKHSGNEAEVIKNFTVGKSAPVGKKKTRAELDAEIKVMMGQEDG